MARGFGATRGSGATDNVASVLATHSTLRSYAIWHNRNGEGGNNRGRLWEKGSNTLDTCFNNHANIAGTYVFLRGWSGAGTGAQWTWARPSANAWSHLGLSYDGGSSSNAPVVYVDGSSVPVTNANPASGTITTNANVYNVGNRSTVDRGWDGDLAEFAMWDVLLTADEFAALGKGVCPLLIRPASLVEYIPMVRDNGSRKLAAPTIAGTAVQPHVPVRYVGFPQDRWLSSGAVGATFAAALMSATAQSFAASIAAGATFSAALSTATAAMRVADAVGGAALQAALMAASATLLDASAAGGAAMSAEAMLAIAALRDASALGGALWSGELGSASAALLDADMSGTEVGEFAAEVMTAVASLADADITAGAQFTAQLLTAQTQMLSASVGAGALFDAAVMLATARSQDAQMSAGSTLLAVTMAASAQVNTSSMVGGARFVAELASAAARAYSATMVGHGEGDATFNAEMMAATARLLAAALITVAVNWISCFEDGEEPKRVVWPAVRRPNSAPAPEYPRELPAILRQPDTFNDWEL